MEWIFNTVLKNKIFERMVIGLFMIVGGVGGGHLPPVNGLTYPPGIDWVSRDPLQKYLWNYIQKW